MQKQVRDLVVGDILTSGCEVIEAPFDSVRCPKGKCNIGIKHTSGTCVIRQWWKSTVVGVKEKAVFKTDLSIFKIDSFRDPGLPPQSFGRSPDFDYWGGSRL